MPQPLFHPRMLEALTATFYTSSCTIQYDTSATYTAGGQAVPDWQNLSGHVLLPCAVATISQTSPNSGRELRRDEYTSSNAQRHVSFPAYYPQIKQKMRAVVDGQPYDIISAEHDSLRGMTRLKVELVEALEVAPTISVSGDVPAGTDFEHPVAFAVEFDIDVMPTDELESIWVLVRQDPPGGNRYIALTIRADGATYLGFFGFFQNQFHSGAAGEVAAGQRIRLEADAHGAYALYADGARVWSETDEDELVLSNTHGTVSYIGPGGAISNLAVYNLA